LLSARNLIEFFNTDTAIIIFHLWINIYGLAESILYWWPADQRKIDLMSR
jgi:hypothetical protein